MNRWISSYYKPNEYEPLPTEEPVEMQNWNTTTKNLYPDTKPSAPPKIPNDNQSKQCSVPTPNPILNIMIRSETGIYLSAAHTNIELIDGDSLTDGVNESFFVHLDEKSHSFTLQASSHKFLSFNEFGEVMLSEKPENTFNFVKHKQNVAQVAIADTNSGQYLNIDDGECNMKSNPCGLQVIVLPQLRTSDPLYLVPAMKIKSQVWKKYFATSKKYAYKMTCDQEKPRTNEVNFLVERYPHFPTGICLKTCCSKYVAADDEGRVIGNKTHPQSNFEQFELFVINEGSSSFFEFAIRNCGTKGYVFAEPDGRILADSRNVGVWEKLVVEFFSVYVPPNM